ncbi:tumor necrosis factor receptor superfamily member 6 [Pleuronectes platessa]|uniref:tumor necrosis factor receptor superfamily member 6 n=1 Tax=Pleuronectes platessa TaxID=8262 RepID=UPI00232A1A18|nr:tumor necrosis factor receptor superfamily member 6 [Pleuronectes platessa]
MQLLCYVALLFLCSLPFLSSVFPLQCSRTEYPWPVTDSKNCCKKCAPGKHMDRRDSCNIQCLPCPKDRFSDTYNVERSCTLCRVCTEDNMEYKSSCNPTHNAECRCKTGFSCNDKDCTQCVPIPVTAKPTLPPSTTTPTTEAVTTFKPIKPIAETAWFLVIIALLCIGIALVVVTKIKPLLRWIRSKDSFFFTDKPEQSYSEDDSECRPVQEVCGECDQPIDVCIKC